MVIWGKVLDHNVTHRRPVLKSPVKFVSSEAEWHHQPSSPVNGQLTFSQAQLQDLLRRECTAMRTTWSHSSTGLEKSSMSSPGINGEPTDNITVPVESPSAL